MDLVGSFICNTKITKQFEINMDDNDDDDVVAVAVAVSPAAFSTAALQIRRCSSEYLMCNENMAVPDHILKHINVLLQYIQYRNYRMFLSQLMDVSNLLETHSRWALERGQPLPAVFDEDHLSNYFCKMHQAAAYPGDFTVRNEYMYSMARGLLCRALCKGSSSEFNAVFNLCWGTLDNCNWKDLLHFALDLCAQHSVTTVGGIIQYWVNRYFLDQVLSASTCYYHGRHLGFPHKDHDVFALQRTMWPQSSILVTLDAQCFQRVQELAAKKRALKDVDLYLVWKQWAVQGDVVLRAAMASMMTWPVWKRCQRVKQLLLTVTGWVKHASTSSASAPRFVLHEGLLVPRSTLVNYGAIIDVVYSALDVAESCWRSCDKAEVATACSIFYHTISTFQEHEYAALTRLADLFFKTHGVLQSVSTFNPIACHALIHVQRRVCDVYRATTPEAIQFQAQVHRWSELRAAWASTVYLAAVLACHHPLC